MQQRQARVVVPGEKGVVSVRPVDVSLCHSEKQQQR